VESSPSLTYPYPSPAPIYNHREVEEEPQILYDFISSPSTPPQQQVQEPPVGPITPEQIIGSARIVSSVRHAPANQRRGNIGGEFSQQGRHCFCSTGQHWCPSDEFGSGAAYKTCDRCQKTQHDRHPAETGRGKAARFEARDQEIADELIQQLEKLVPPSQLPDTLPEPTADLPNNPEPIPDLPTNPESVQEVPDDPLDAPAISEMDKEHLQKCCEKLMNIRTENCTSCNEEWFDLDVKDGCCAKCRKSIKYMTSNLMDPGPGWNDLPPLTQMKELLISPTHALIQCVEGRQNIKVISETLVRILPLFIGEYHFYQKSVILW